MSCKENMKNDQKRKYLAKWVQILQLDSEFYRKTGVVMDEEYLHNGVMCCRVIVGPNVVPVESQYLKLIQV
jgi:hypothetical protein